MAALRTLAALVVALAALLLAAGPVRAQGAGAAGADVLAETRARYEQELAPGVSLSARAIELSRDWGSATFRGSVRLTSKRAGAVQIFADALVAWGDFSKGKPTDLTSAPEIYAEGGVFVLAFGDAFECERLFLDLAEGRGRLEKVTARSGGGASGGTPLLARAEEARVSEGLTFFEAEQALLSSCTYHEPHFDVTAERIAVRRRIPDEIALREEGARPGAEITLEGPTFEVYDVPLFHLPGEWDWDTAWNPYVPRVRPGRSRRFGGFLLSEVPVYPGDALDVRARVDLMSERGVGLGGIAQWSGPSGDRRTYTGFLDAYFVRDQGDLDVATRLAVPEDDRFRLRAFHRDDLPLGLRREVELSWISDRGFLPEFFEQEFKQGKEQETVGYVRWLDGNMGATLLGRWRLNDFQTQTESLPKARWSWIGEPFLADVLPGGRGLFLSTDWELLHARARYDEDLLYDEETVARADLSQRLDWPFPVGPLQLDPFVDARYTAWSTGRRVSPLDPFEPLGDGRSIDRVLLGAGALATTDAWRDFGGWRHISTPSVGYVNTFWDGGTTPDELYRLDAVEDARVSETVLLSWRNRLQHWAVGAVAPADVLDLDLATRVFLRPGRDNAGDRMGFLRQDLRVSPTPGIRGRWRADWDVNRQGGLVRSDAELAVRPSPDLYFAASYRLLENEYRAIEGAAEARLTEKWGGRVSSQYDFEQSRFTSNRLALRRYTHRFVLEFTLDADFGEDDVRVAVNFLPQEFFRSETSYVGDVQLGATPLY